MSTSVPVARVVTALPVTIIRATSPVPVLQNSRDLAVKLVSLSFQPVITNNDLFHYSHKKRALFLLYFVYRAVPRPWPGTSGERVPLQGRTGGSLRQWNMGDSLRRFMGCLGRKSCVSSAGIQHVSFDILLTIPTLLPQSFREVHHNRKTHLELLAEQRAVSTFCLIDLGCRILLTVILYLNIL